MPWFNLDPAFPIHPKVFQAGVAAWGYFTAMLIYANRHRTGGFVPVSDLVLVFPGISRRRAITLCARLVQARRPGHPHGLLEVREGGYQIHDYAQYQFSPLREPARAWVEAEGHEERSPSRTRVGKRSGQARHAARQATGAPEPNRDPDESRQTVLDIVDGDRARSGQPVDISAVKVMPNCGQTDVNVMPNRCENRAPVEALARKITDLADPFTGCTDAVPRHNGSVAPMKECVLPTGVVSSELEQEEPKTGGNPPLSPLAYAQIRVRAPADFEELWRVWPRERRQDKKKAVAAWLKLRPDVALRATIIRAIQRQMQTAAWRREDGRYIPHLHRWLRDERWEDEVVIAPAERLLSTKTAKNADNLTAWTNGSP